MINLINKIADIREKIDSVKVGKNGISLEAYFVADMVLEELEDFVNNYNRISAIGGKCPRCNKKNNKRR